MTELLERATGEAELTLLPSPLTIRQQIEARLTEIHREVPGRHELICSALRIGTPAIAVEVQV